MTTIAWRDGVIVSDRQATCGGTITKSTKMFVVKGYAIGVSGALARGIAFVKWFEGERKEDCPLDDGTLALVMDLSTGQCEQWESPGQAIPVEDEFAAIGSGADYAYGAMEMGADAHTAVRIASKWDTDTGKGFQVIKMRGDVAR